MTIESRVFTFEDGLWNIRGRYEKACEEDEELVWSNVDGEYVTHILIVSLFCFYLPSLIIFIPRTPLAMSQLQSLLHLLFLHQRFMLGHPPIFIISSLSIFLVLISNFLTAVRKV